MAVPEGDARGMKRGGEGLYTLERRTDLLGANQQSTNTQTRQQSTGASPHHPSWLNGQWGNYGPMHVETPNGDNGRRQRRQRLVTAIVGAARAQETSLLSSLVCFHSFSLSLKVIYNLLI
jgi:hypothetical protein